MEGFFCYKKLTSSDLEKPAFQLRERVDCVQKKDHTMKRSIDFLFCSSSHHALPYRFPQTAQSSDIYDRLQSL
jgi:hypothetical protein